MTYAAVSLIQMFVIYLQFMDRSSSRGGPSGDSTGHVIFIFIIVKLLLFVIAMGMFVGGLAGLRLRPDRESGVHTRD